MPRTIEKLYRQRLMLAMTAYVGAMLLVWPVVGGTASLPWKIVLALTPVLPMLYVVWLMVRRVWRSDELEQRTHLLALGAATVATGVLSLVGGFLAAAHVVALDGSILIWVFPAMLICYDATRWWVARRYGASGYCEDDGGMPLYLRCLLGAAVLGLLALLMHVRHRDDGAVELSWLAAASVLGAAILGALRWRRFRHEARSGSVP